jgi:hypothetical protein
LQEKIKALVEADRAALLSYLQGETATCAQIDQQMIDSYARNKRKAEDISLEPTEAVAPVNNADADRLKKLRSKFFPLYSSNNAIYNTSGNEDLRSVLKIFNNAVLARISDTGSKSTTSASAAATSSSSKTNQNRSQQKPIIVVPSALTAAINMFNAKQFLEEGKYVKPEVAMQQGVEKKKVDVIVRRMPGSSRVQLYKLIDDPTILPAEDWARVCAVFVTGQTWQFNRWKESDPVQLFQQVLATHLTLAGRPVDSKVQAWHCRVLAVDEFQDYVNAGVASQFWLYLDDFIQRNKPQLAPSTSATS